MARKSGSTIVQEELYPHGVERSRVGPSRVESARNNHDNDLDDARLVDLDVDEESPFLRGKSASRPAAVRSQEKPSTGCCGWLWLPLRCAPPESLRVRSMPMASVPGASAWNRATTSKSRARRT